MCSADPQNVGLHLVGLLMKGLSFRVFIITSPQDDAETECPTSDDILLRTTSHGLHYVQVPLSGPLLTLAMFSNPDLKTLNPKPQTPRPLKP